MPLLVNDLLNNLSMNQSNHDATNSVVSVYVQYMIACQRLWLQDQFPAETEC